MWNDTTLLIPLLGVGLEIKTFLLMFHLIAISVGFGSATLLDIWVAKKYLLDKAIGKDDFAIVSYASRVVALGLGLTWVSGGLYLYHLQSDGGLILQNPKFLFKIWMVCMLTLNGMFIHAVIIPHMKRRIGAQLFDRTPPTKRALFLTSGAISLASWYCLILLGVAREMNHKVPFENIVHFYFALVAAALLVISCAKVFMDTRRSKSAATEGALQGDVA